MLNAPDASEPRFRSQTIKVAIALTSIAGGWDAVAEKILLTMRGVNSAAPFLVPGTGFAPMRPRRLAMAFLFALAAAGCTRQTELPSVWAHTETPYMLDSGDKLRVVVFGQDGLTNSYAVDTSGAITMPLIGAVEARGHTPADLSRAVAARLRQGYVREPHVAVEVDTYRPFFILGEVTFPGQYPYVANMTVETAVAIAGGFSPRAFKASVTINRPMVGEIVRTPAPLNTPVRPGDTIVVAERWF